MDEDTINDLKQFITATVSQATSDMATKDDVASTKDDIANLSSQVTDLGLKIDTIVETFNDNLNDHENRITKLENQTAHA